MTDFLYDLVYMISATGFVSLLAVTLLGGAPEGWTIFLAMVFATAAAAYCHVKSKLKIFLVLVPVSAGLGWLLLQEREQRLERLLSLRWVGLIFLVSLLAALLIKYLAKYPVWRLLCAGAMVVTLILRLTGDMPTSKGVVAMAAVFLTAVLAEEVQGHWKKKGYTEGRKHLVYILPFLLIPSLCVWVVPMPEKPYDWDFAVRLWQTVSGRVESLAESVFAKYDYLWSDSVGFAEHARIRGRLGRNDTVVMSVTADKYNGRVLYLSGKIFDTFDGKSWSCQNQGEEQQRMLEAIESMAAARQYCPKYPNNYVREEAVTVEYRGFSAQMLFVPPAALVSDGKLGEYTFHQVGGNLLTENKLGYGTTYHVRYLRFNRDQEEFQNYLRAEQEEPEEEVWNQTRNSFPVKDRSEHSLSNYREYKEQIPKYYLPETEVSQEVRELLDGLLAGADTPYDKCKRIEQYLSGLTYTNRPGDLPGSVKSASDYLDYFLLEKKEGFCIHFATAFVLLARNEGIPARYVQGFHTQRDPSGVTEVHSYHAHAWPEVYFENVGWISFEPTPGYGYFSAWEMQKPAEENLQDEVPEEPVTTPGPTPAPQGPQEVEEVPGEPEESWPRKVLSKWYVVVLPIFFLVLAGGLLLAWEQVVLKRRFRRMSPEEKVALFFRRNLRLLRMMGYRPEPGETLEEFRLRVARELGENPVSFLRRYEEYAYGGAQEADELQAALENGEKQLIAWMKEKTGRRFFWLMLVYRRSDTK